MANTWIVKCDECKKTMKRGVSFSESVQGGVCNACRLKMVIESDRFWKNVKKRDKKLRKETMIKLSEMEKETW